MPEPLDVLVIEDDPAIRKLLEVSLGKAGYSVASATNGLDGLMQVDRAEPKPRLLIIDIMMPELDGLSLVRALRAQKSTRSIPIILITAKADAKTIAEGISAGAKFYVTKPFVIADLLAKVKKAIAPSQ